MPQILVHIPDRNVRVPLRSIATTTSKEQPMHSVQAQQKSMPLSSTPARAAQSASGILEEGRFLVTPDIARQILAKFHYEGQRRISRPHVAKLAHEMASGVWTPGSQLAFAVLPSGQSVLVNGYHRLHAVQLSGVSVEFQLLLVPVAKTDEIQSLYYRFDTVQNKRSDRMVLSSLGLAARLEIGRDTLVGAYKAGIIIANGLKMVQGAHLEPQFGTPDGKLAAVEGYWPEVKIYDEIIRGTPSGIPRRLRLPTIMAVALVTLKYQPKKAMEFWKGVADDDGLAKGDPRKVMIKMLVDGERKDRLGVLMIYTANCWNAFFLGHTLDHTKAYKASECRPLGTPFSGLRRDRE